MGELRESYIYFNEAPPPSEKTRAWFVLAKESDELLGTVKWLGRWRCYAFHPLDRTIYEQRCLRDIANFCQDRTSEHRRGWSRSR